MEPSVSIDTVFVRVRDMAASTAFYRDVLGLEISSQSDYWTSFKLGNGQLALHGPSDPGLAPPSGGWVVCLTAHDLGDLRRRLQGAGVWVADRDHSTPRGDVLEFHDPEGNSLQAINLIQD